MGEKIYALKKEDFNTFMAAPIACKLNLLEELVWSKCAIITTMLVSVDRDEVENNPDFKQLIPYVVITDENFNVLTYTRKGSEKRLVGQKSIGFGGHWKTEESFITCFKRELTEEIGLNLQYGEYEVLVEDIIYSEATPVDSVHMGILLLIEVYSEEFGNATYAEDEVRDVKLTSIEDINPDELETWSKIAYEKLLIKKKFDDMYWELIKQREDTL